MRIQIAGSDEEIQRCFPVMRQLRPLLVEAGFVAKVRDMQSGGFRLAFLEDDAEIRVVAGFRAIEYLRGRVFFVDDLVKPDGHFGPPLPPQALNEHCFCPNPRAHFSWRSYQLSAVGYQSES